MQQGLITYELWSGGLINQVMSVENASIIAWATDNIVHIHSNKGLDSSWRNISKERIEALKNNFPKINQLIKPKHLLSFNDESFGNKRFCENEIVVKDFGKTAISLDGTTPSNEFLENRKYTALSKEKHYRFIHTLSWYSIAFYDASSMLKEHDWCIEFRDEYTDLARRIQNYIGSFSAIHVRKLDHARIVPILDRSIVEAVESFENKPVLVLTDDSASFKKLKIKNTLMLDDLIMSEFLDDFIKLSFHDETTFGLVCLLVACGSSQFIGTLGSTYSGYIMREVNKKRLTNQSWKYIGQEDRHHLGVYSWNEHPKLSLDVKKWYMEWRESCDPFIDK